MLFIGFFGTSRQKDIIAVVYPQPPDHLQSTSPTAGQLPDVQVKKPLVSARQAQINTMPPTQRALKYDWVQQAFAGSEGVAAKTMTETARTRSNAFR